MNRARVLLPTVVILLLTGCIGSPSKQSGMMKSVDVKFAPDAQQLRILTRGLVDPFCGRIEDTADKIIANAEDRKIRRAALEWKVNAIPSMREALFRPDPLAAIMDGWAFALQLRNYFESENGREAFGDSADVAFKAMRKLANEIEAFAQQQVVSGDLTQGRSFVAEWARAHPIDGMAAGRQSILNQIMHFRKSGDTKGLNIIGSMGVTMDDLARRLEIHSAQLPKLAAWQAELTLIDVLEHELVDLPFDELPQMVDVALELGATVEELPALVEGEREAVLQAVRAERLETLDFVQRERLETLAWVTAEREATLAEIEIMRQATLEDVRLEIQLLVEVLRDERDAAVAVAEGLTTRSIDHALVRAEGLIDYTLRRLLFLCGVLLVVGIVLILLARAIFRRSSPPIAPRAGPA